VKRGIRDTDDPDLPLGGWAGTVSAVERTGLCRVRWSRETFDAIPPAFKNRCDRDGPGLEFYWLPQDDLEPDPGGLLEIECPAEITTGPRASRDRDDRIRMIFGLTGHDPLPEVDHDTLETYHAHLQTNLSFPFEAEHTPESGHLFRHSRTVKVTGLDDADEEPMIDEMHGILCTARHQRRVMTVALGELEIDKGRPNRQLVKDYCYWFSTNRAAGEGEIDPASGPSP
jgi:hypothetical protein